MCSQTILCEFLHEWEQSQKVIGQALTKEYRQTIQNALLS